ncbi:unnamed protein product [Orchesella dallaii]|uniref:Alpha-carbonic anhydrase domain-containing protein n=1 Tax=Orchesella dallaii TaxID=48710 RepID=A0ABP1S762_9HEXA
MVTGAERLMLDFRKRSGYRKVLHGVDGFIDDVRANEGFPDMKTMRDVIHFMKYGSRGYDLKYRRPVIQKSHYKQLLIEHHKKRGMVEYGNLGIPEEELLEDIKSEPLKAVVTQEFQISWLMPPDGGYYVYDGTSPLPPCNRAQKVIVFKKPITMSRSQIQTLTRVPTSFHPSEDIRSTHPIIHDLEFTVNLQAPPNGAIRHEEVKVPIYFQKRNHLFLGFDSVNQNGVEQSDRIKSEKARSAGSFHRAEINLVWIALLYFPALIIFYTT